MNQLLAKLKTAYPQFIFKPGEALFWSPKEQTIYYPETSNTEVIWGLLHETGHALLKHYIFTTDIDLLNKEIAAWRKAKQLASDYQTSIPDEHIEECLDSYRNWLHKRSECPGCGNHGLQDVNKAYRCLNCAETWKVSSSNAYRPYRLSKGVIA